MNKASWIAAATLSALVLGPANIASAAILTFNSEVAFDAAISNSTKYDFSSFEQSLPADNPLTNGPVTFASTPVSAIYNDEGYGQMMKYFATVNDGGADTFTSASLTGGVYSAVGFNIGTYYGPDLVSINVDQSPVTYQLLTSGAPTTDFIGFLETDGSGITNVNFSTSAGEFVGSEFDVINFTTGTIAPTVVSGVPETSTWAMMLLGFGGLGFLAYRKAREGSAVPMMAA